MFQNGWSNGTLDGNDDKIDLVYKFSPGVLNQV